MNLSPTFNAEAEANQLHQLLGVLEKVKASAAGPFVDDYLSDAIHDLKGVIETEKQERGGCISAAYADWVHDDRANGWSGVGL